MPHKEHTRRALPLPFLEYRQKILVAHEQCYKFCYYFHESLRETV